MAPWSIFGNTESLTNQQDVTNLLTQAITASALNSTSTIAQTNTITFTGNCTVTAAEISQTNNGTMSANVFTSVSAQQSANTSMVQNIINQASAEGRAIQGSSTISSIINDVQTSISNNMTTNAYVDLTTAINQANNLNENCTMTAGSLTTQLISQSNVADIMSTAVGKSQAVQNVANDIVQSFKNTSTSETKSSIAILAIMIGAVIIVALIVAAYFAYLSVKVVGEATVYIIIGLIIFGIGFLIGLGIYLTYLYYERKKIGQSWLAADACQTSSSATAAEKVTNCAASYLIASDGTTHLGTSCQGNRCLTVPCTTANASTTCAPFGSTSTCFVGSSGGTSGYCTAAPPPPPKTPPASS